MVQQAGQGAQGARRKPGLRDVLLDLLFPPRCVGCDRRGEWLCAACRAALAPPTSRCLRCGRAISQRRRPPLCAACRPLGSPLAGLLAGHAFDGALRAAVHALKYRRARHLAEPLADLLLALPLPPADLLIPIPLHPSRLAQRGYNQSSLLAVEIARVTGLPLDEGILRRTRPTPPQTELLAAERRANVVGAFEVVASAGPRLAGRRVLLLDDVCTTGSTLEAAAACLIEAGAAEIWGVVLARAT